MPEAGGANLEIAQRLNEKHGTLGNLARSPRRSSKFSRRLSWRSLQSPPLTADTRPPCGTGARENSMVKRPVSILLAQS